MNVTATFVIPIMKGVALLIGLIQTAVASPPAATPPEAAADPPAIERPAETSHTQARPDHENAP